MKRSAHPLRTGASRSVSALLLLLLVWTGCQWVDFEAIPCENNRQCFEGYTCVELDADGRGHCSATPGDDDDAVGDDDDDDDSAGDDDAAGDDDSAQVERLAPALATLLIAFEVSGGSPQPVTMTLTTSYFEDEAGQDLLCTRRFQVAGTARFGAGVLAGCAICTGEMEFEAIDVVDLTELSPLPGECDPEALRDGVDIGGSLLGQEPGPGRDLLHLGLLDAPAWTSSGQDLGTAGYGFTAAQRQTDLTNESASFELTHAILADLGRVGSEYANYAPDLAPAASGDWWGIGWTWRDTAASPVAQGPPLMLGQYSGALWYRSVWQ